MSDAHVIDFRLGLDSRRSAMTLPPGALVTAVNCHVTSGARLEKRKAFVELANPNQVETDSLPEDTFGMQPTSEGMAVFGSADQSGNSFPSGFIYKRLRHPQALAGGADVAMTALVCSCDFGGKSFAVAKFADGRHFSYYDGTIIPDFHAGLILEYMAAASDPAGAIGEHLRSLVNATNSYTSPSSPDLIPSGAAYSSPGGSYSLSGLTAGRIYYWTKGTGDTNLVNGAQTLTASGYFTAAGTSVTLNGTAGGTIAGTVQDFGKVQVYGLAGSGGFSTDITTETTAGTATAVLVSTGIPSVAGLQSVGSFTITFGRSGAGNQILTVKINETDVLLGAVNYSSSQQATCSLVAQQINRNTATSGYFASASGGTVQVYSLATGSTPNGYTLSVSVSGEVVIDSGGFVLGGLYSSKQVVSITDDVYSENLLPGGGSGAAASLSLLAEKVAGDIRATSTHYTAVADGPTVYVGRKETESGSGDVTFTISTDSGLTATALTASAWRVSLSDYSLAVYFPLIFGTKTKEKESSSVVTTLSGVMNPPYSYFWRLAASSGRTDRFIVSATSPTGASTKFNVVRAGDTDKIGTTASFSFVCEVTDASGTMVKTESVVLTCTIGL